MLSRALKIVRQNRDMSILKKRSCMLTCNKSFISSLLFYYLVYPLLLKVCGSVFPKEIVVKYDNSFIFSGTTFYGWLIVFVLLASPQLTNLWLKLPKSDHFRPRNFGLLIEFPAWGTQWSEISRILLSADVNLKASL